VQYSGGAPPLPPRPDDGSRAALEHRERLGVLELGLLRRARRRGLEGRGGCQGGSWGWCESFQPRRVAFYRLQPWAPRVVWCSGASQSWVKRRKGEGAGGGLELRGTEKDPRRVQNCCGGLQKWESLRRVRLPWPRFSGQISVREGTGREGEGKWE
jgi:hypothetical protein